MAINQKLTESSQPSNLKYAQDCYIESFNFLQARKQRQVRQLILLNNLQRGDMNIASTLLLTLFNRTLSTNYDDKQQVKFLPSQGINQQQLNSYNVLYQSDYLEMNKPKMDYDWAWDTIAFGSGYCETKKFNLKRKIMEPSIINPLVFGYDPFFEEVQEWRYYWKWITKSKVEIQRLINNGTITGITKPEEIPSGVDPYLWNYKSLRDKAKKGIEPASDSMGGDIFQILEFYSYDDDGNKQCEWIDKSFSKCIYHETLDLEDLDYGDQEEKGSKWPIVKKECFREPHSSISFGVFDLLEDKHRAKSVLLNLAFLAAKDRANPLYWYNDNVTDVTSFMSRQVSQHIKLEGNNTGDNSVGPINTEDPMSAGLIQFISMLTQEASDPVGAGQSAQPQQSQKDKTATSDAINQQLNDMAISLQSKIMQFGESEFASHWFHRYAKYTDVLKDKMANIVGVIGVESTLIDMKDFNTDYPPGVLVYSAKEADYKETVLRQDLMQQLPTITQTMDADGLRNFYKYVYWPKFLKDPSLVNIMFPKTLDEMKAEDENIQLVDDKYVQAQPTDNHTTHIYKHNQIPPGQRTWAMWFHINEHEKLLAQQKQQAPQQNQGANGQQATPKVNESIAFNMLPPDGQKQMAAQAGIQLDDNAIASNPNQQQPGQSSPQQSAPKVGGATQKQAPMAAATPLKTATQPAKQLINK